MENFTIPQEPGELVAPPDAMTRLSELANLLLQAKLEIHRLDTAMAAQQALAIALEREHIPELMKECGFTEIKLQDDSVITLKHEFEFGITEVNRPAAHRWLRIHELGGIIKIAVVVPFGRDQGDAALALQTLLQSKGLDATAGETVNYQTLKATLRELREKGTAVPDDLFGIFPFDLATIKLPKGVKLPAKPRKQS